MYACRFVSTILVSVHHTAPDTLVRGGPVGPWLSGLTETSELCRNPHPPLVVLEGRWEVVGEGTRPLVPPSRTPARATDSEGSGRSFAGKPEMAIK